MAKTTRLVMVALAILLLAAGAFAQQQDVAADTSAAAGNQNTATVAPNASLTFDMNYFTTPASNPNSFGITVALFYDSTKMSAPAFGNILPKDFVTAAGPAPDDNSLWPTDGDATTNSVVSLQWADGVAPADWPSGTLPVKIADAMVTMAAAFAGSTHINIVAVENSPGFTVTNPLDVVTITAPVPTAVATLLPNPASTQAGANATMTVTLNQAAGAGGQLVNLSSNNAAVTVPASVTVPAGATSVQFAAHGVSVGTATVSAQVGATPAVNATVNVTAATITLTPATANVANGGTVQMTVQITPGQVATVTLASAGGHTTVPASVNTNAAGTATFNVTGTSVGGPDTITATLPIALGGGNDTSQVTVQAVTLTVSPTTVASATVGAPITFTACFSAAQPGATVTFAGPNVANFAFSPTAPTIAANAVCPAGATFTATPLVVTGAPQVFDVSAGGLGPIRVQVSAVAGITCTLSDAGNGVLLTVSQAQPGALTIGVTSSDTAVLTVPATFQLPAGATSVLIPYSVLTAGTSTVTTTLPVTVGGSSCNVAAVVNPVPVPALGGLGLALLAGLLALAGAFFVRKH